MKTSAKAGSKKVEQTAPDSPESSGSSIIPLSEFSLSMGVRVVYAGNITHCSSYMFQERVQEPGQSS